MIRRREVAAVPAVLADFAPEALATDAAGACQGAPRVDPIKAPRSCDVCGHELLDEELTCPPCWSRDGQGKTGFLRAIFASVAAMLRR